MISSRLAVGLQVLALATVVRVDRFSKHNPTQPPHSCSNCGQEPFWDGKPLVLVLDHINGINNDNRLENLRLLCPNCNSQTETFCKGGEKRKAPVRTKALLDAIRQTETIKDALLSLGMEPSANNYARITRLTQ